MDVLLGKCNRQGEEVEVLGEEEVVVGELVHPQCIYHHKSWCTR